MPTLHRLARYHGLAVIMRVPTNDYVRARLFSRLSVATITMDTFQPFRCRISRAPRRRHTYIYVDVVVVVVDVSVCSPGRPRKQHSVRSKSDFSHRHGYSAISRRPARGIVINVHTVFRLSSRINQTRAETGGGGFSMLAGRALFRGVTAAPENTFPRRTGRDFVCKKFHRGTRARRECAQNKNEQTNFTRVSRP